MGDGEKWATQNPSEDIGLVGGGDGGAVNRIDPGKEADGVCVGGGRGGLSMAGFLTSWVWRDCVQ